MTDTPPPAGTRVTGTAGTTREDHELFTWLGTRLGTTAHRAELAIGAVLALAAVAFTASMATDMWFGGDEMEYLAHRSAFDLGDLTRPVGGHWTTWTVLLLRGTYRMVGLEWWPWYFVPRLIGHTLLVTLIWRVVRHRGADPLVGIFAYATLLVLGSSGYQRGMQIGNWAVYVALVVCALVINRRPDAPTVGDRVIVAGALMVAVLGNGYAVAVIGGLTGALVLGRRILVWLPALLPAALAYGAWWLTFRHDIRPKPELSIDRILQVPAGAFRVGRSAVETATALPGALAALVVVGIAVWIAVLVVRRQLDVFDSIMLCTLIVGLSLLSLQRIAVDGEAAMRLRYGYSVSVLLALLLLRHVRLSRAAVVRALFVAAGCWIVVTNAGQMRTAMELRNDNGRANRVLYVAAAELMSAGEPVVSGPSTITPGLETDELRTLLDNGYAPDPLPPDQPDRQRILAEARGALRINLIGRIDRRRGWSAPPGTAPSTDADVDEDGCVSVAPGSPVTAVVTDAAVLAFHTRQARSLTMTWTDGYGIGIRQIVAPEITRGEMELAAPTDTAELTFESDDDITVCGLAP